MYSHDFDKMVTHLLPPHWRSTWKGNFIRVCCEPFREVFAQMKDFAGTVPIRTNLNSQVGVLEYQLNAIANNNLPLISISDGQNGSFIVNMPLNEPAKDQIIAFLDRYRLGGKTYSINEY